MNILITSCGTRNKIVQFFKEALGSSGKVIATDCSPLAPALYEADTFYIVPEIDDPEYLNKIIDICQKEQINGILSLIDPELSLLAKNKNRLKEMNICLIGSEYEQCEICLDKYKMYKWLKNHHYKTPKTYNNIDDFKNDLEENKISFPVFIKPVKGSASISIQKVENLKDLEALMENEPNLIIQEFMDCVELGADVYVDLISKKVTSIFTKVKNKMRAGETDKATSYKDEKLFKLLEKFVEEFKFLGPIDIDVFYKNNEYYISEVNPRFGGGYPFAYLSGIDHMSKIIDNLNNIETIKNIGRYKSDLQFAKYSEIKAIPKK